jgi:hypothetical protein
MTPTSRNIETEQPTSAVSGAAVESSTGELLISLTPLSAESLDATLANVANAFPAQTTTGDILVAAPDAGYTVPPDSPHGNVRLVTYAPTVPTASALFLTAADYLNTFKMAEEQNAGACLLLGPESQSLSPQFVSDLAAAVLDSPSADLVVPRYHLGPNEGLVNSAILYPVTRALYGSYPRYPLAIDLGLSLRMAEHLAMVAQRFTAAGQTDGIVWPVAEAAAANYKVIEIDAGPRSLPQPSSSDLNALLAEIAGSFFADIEAKANIWQRARPLQGARPVASSAESVESLPDVTPMLEAFRVAYSNLQEIWALVLPPNSLLGLKHLSLMPPASFRMSDELWTRIVYDFILAYRLRTINRGHLLGALTSLYLGWVASHIILSQAGTPPEQHIQDQAATFENDKAYLVSRWRWPDRFNP